MDITKLKHQLQFAIPKELYDIEPGQVVFFVPIDGISLRGFGDLRSIFSFFERLYKFSGIKVSIIPTREELLIGTLAGRNQEEVGIPYKVVVSTDDSLVEFASQYFGEDVEQIVNRASKNAFINSKRYHNTETPAIVEIDPENRPTINVQSQGIEQRIDSSYQSGFDMGMKLSKPEKGSAAERKLIAKEEKKLEKILRECAVLGIELDIDRIKKKVEEDLKKTVDYKLIIKAERDPHIPLNILYTTFDIYVADGDGYKLDLMAIEKAVYLAFLLYEDGILIQDTYGEFREIVQKIYGCLPYDERCEKESGGIRDKKGTTYEAHMNTLRSNICTIRAAVAEKVEDPLVAQEFAIEGFAKSPYGIERSTPEIRAQVKKLFGL